MAYVGAIEREDEMIEIVGFEDEVNLADWLAYRAAAGEIVLNRSDVLGQA